MLRNSFGWPVSPMSTSTPKHWGDHSTSLYGPNAQSIIVSPLFWNLFGFTASCQLADACWITAAGSYKFIYAEYSVNTTWSSHSKFLSAAQSLKSTSKQNNHSLLRWADMGRKEYHPSFRIPFGCPVACWWTNQHQTAAAILHQLICAEYKVNLFSYSGIVWSCGSSINLHGRAVYKHQFNIFGQMLIVTMITQYAVTHWNDLSPLTTEDPRLTGLQVT